MKKLNGKKLALHRETLATLSAETLTGVAGGKAATLPTILPTSIGPGCTVSITVCPSRNHCPPPPTKTLLACIPGNGNQ
jgi:hypothetical protein